MRVRVAGQFINILFALIFSVSSASPRLTCQSIFLTSTAFSYPEAVRLLDPEQPHTIENIKEYLMAKLGAEVVKETQNEKVDFIIIRGPARNPLSHLDHYNIRTVKELANPFGAFNVTQVKYKNGRSSFVFTNINGESRYLQVLSFLKLAKINERKIILKGQLSDYHSLYMETFRKVGHVPDLVVFGFSNTSFEVITESLVKSQIPVAQIKDKNLSYANSKWQKSKFDEHELKNMGLQILSFSNGKKIWFIDNEYGDRATVIMQALQDHGVSNILLLGTAGSLNPQYKVGTIVSPCIFCLENGESIPANFTENAHREGKHGHVDSPALETKLWLKQQLDRGIDFIDVELQKASSAVRKNIKYDAYLVISDELNSTTPQDYTKWSESHRLQTKKILKPILEGRLNGIGVHGSTEIQSYDIKYFEVRSLESEAGL